MVGARPSQELVTLGGDGTDINMTLIAALKHWAHARGVEAMLFLTLSVCYVYFLPRWADWSQNSRLDLTLAIVDRGTLSIDDYYQNTGDYALFEGRYYLDKAPGPSFLAVPVYALVRPILRSAPAQRLLERMAHQEAFAATLREGGTGLLTEKIYFAVVLYIVTIVVIALPSAALGVMLFRMLNQFGAGAGWSALIVLIYGLATNAFPYAGHFFSHQLAAFLLFGAFFLGFQMRRGVSPRWTAAAGFMLGYTLISEYPTALIAGAVAVYIALTLRARRWLVVFALAGLPPLILLAAYNWVIFHTPLPVGYEYSALYTEQHGTGFLSLTYPHVSALWGITFGSYRGLFYVSPVLLLAAAGFWAWWRLKTLRAEWAVCLWAVMSFILFNGSSVMWQGGYSIGPRYLVPMLPFMTMGLGAFAAAWGRTPWARALTAILGVWSVAVVWAETIGGQNFPDWTVEPLFKYSLPHLLASNIARNLGMVLGLRGWLSLLPLAGFLALMAAALIRRFRAQASVPLTGMAGAPLETRP
jgi:hypothetical protein